MWADKNTEKYKLPAMQTWGTDTFSVRRYTKSRPSAAYAYICLDVLSKRISAVIGEGVALQNIASLFTLILCTCVGAAYVRENPRMLLWDIIVADEDDRDVADIRCQAPYGKNLGSNRGLWRLPAIDIINRLHVSIQK